MSATSPDASEQLCILSSNLDNHPVGNDDDNDGDDDDGDDDDDDDDGDDDSVGKKFGECGGGVIHYIQGAPLAHPPTTHISHFVNYSSIFLYNILYFLH